MRDRTVSRTEPRLLTIGQLSELTGVPVRTIRFYSDSLADGRTLLEPALRSPSGYRLYEVEAAARLELIRTLRELGIGLPTIARVLARELTVAEVAHAQADALEATVRTLRLRQAVKRATLSDAQWQADQEAFGAILAPRAAEAYTAGIAPDSAEGRARATEIFEAWCAELGQPADDKHRARILESLETMNDQRVNRFWELVSVVGDRPHPPVQGGPLYESMQWLSEALRPAA